ncbi:pyruvate kinase [Episyrphus balteatus]|uniref:pyruvate kinase n=1 Tax=Episyrphus balteatus TaxID=286459 RepID=UPI002485DE3E|nr:pyruvate kinase [Episyrphus balteatus]
MENVFQRQSELIRLFVKPQMPTNNEFHEVTPYQLEEYLNEQKDQNPKQKHMLNQYHQLSIMAKVDINTTEIELEKLLHNDVRTLIVLKYYNTPQDMDQIFLKINTCIDRFYRESLYRTPIGIAVAINGELLITGRMRNNQSVFLEAGHIIVLTNNEEYKYCCFKEVVYVSNLSKYSEFMKLGDIVLMGEKGEIEAEVVKCGSLPITIKVTKPGLLKSFMSFKIPFYIKENTLNQKDLADIDDAIKYGANFLMIPEIRSVNFLKSIKKHIGNDVNLIGSIDFEYLESKFIDITDHLMELDAIIIDQIFCPASQKLLENAIAKCKKFGKSLVGNVRLKKCSDFRKLENHMRIRQMDCLMIQKSPLRMKFPLIAKKLLPVGNQKLQIPPLDSLSCKDGIVNFVLRTIYSIPCQGIVVTNACSKAAEAFSTFQIYCPVIVVVDNDQMARLLNLKKNLKTIVGRDNIPSMDLGIDFGRKKGIFSTGDFIICISDSQEEDSQICVNLRAYFLPPIEEELFE